MRYFDANATTPLRPEARAAWLAAEADLWQNPASPSAAGARAHAALEDCRGRLAARLEVPSKSVVFTGGATEANNAVLAHEAARTPDGLAVVSAVEHPSVLEPARKFFGKRLRVLPVDASGVVRLEALEDLLRGGGVSLVSVMAVNNETGVVQPVSSVAELAARHGARWHCDATQWLGKLPAGSLPRGDYIVGCAHKFGGPKGAGLLVFDAEKNPHFAGQVGGGQENHHRAGTVNVPGVVALLAALEAAGADLLQNDTRAAARAEFEAEVMRAIPGASIHGADAPRVANTVSLALPRHANLRWLKRLEKHGFTVSTGSACATADNTPSQVLAAMGCAVDIARRTLRVSAWWETTPADWRALAGALAAVARELDADTGAENGVVIVP